MQGLDVQLAQLGETQAFRDVGEKCADVVDIDFDSFDVDSGGEGEDDDAELSISGGLSQDPETTSRKKRAHVVTEILSSERAYVISAHPLCDLNVEFTFR